MGEIFLWEFWSPMRHFARKLVDLFGAMRNESTPFSTFSGWVKQLAEPEYSIDARVMEVAFPAFFGDAGVDVPARVALESDLTRHGLTVESWEQPYRYRRYAGGANLARGKYFTLCSTKAETIIQTLARELLAYVEATQSGEVYAYDLGSHKDPQIQAAKLWYSRFSEVASFSE